MTRKGRLSFFFFFNDTATTEIYTLSLHDALPISGKRHAGLIHEIVGQRPHLPEVRDRLLAVRGDRKSTRLNSSHGYISYAVFCLKKKKKKAQNVYRSVEHDQKTGLTTFSQFHQHQ